MLATSYFSLKQKRHWLYSLSIISVFLFSCSNVESETLVELELSKEFKLGEKAVEQVHRMYTVAMDNPASDELIFTNFTSPIQLVVINYDGELVETIGKEGRGPKEIQDARFFGFDETGDVLVLDKASAFFKYYNRNSDDVTSFNYPIKKGISVTSRNLQQCDGKWYLAVQLLGKPTLPSTPIVAVFDSTFLLVDTLGGYDPFFEGRTDVMQEALIYIDCQNRLIYTSHGKTPFIQVFSMDDELYQKRTEVKPKSFMLSDKFITMVGSKTSITRFLAQEQSTSLHLAHSDKYLFHIFRNEVRTVEDVRILNDSHHFVAVYDKVNLAYLGELMLPGAAMGSTKNGELIILKDENTSEFQFLNVIPASSHN